MHYHTKQIEAAILAAADKIEQEPESLAFLHPLLSEVAMHKKGCPLAWIGHFLDHPAFRSGSDVARVMYPNCNWDPEHMFMGKMDEICERDYGTPDAPSTLKYEWQCEAAICANCLRALAKEDFS